MPKEHFQVQPNEGASGVVLEFVLRETRPASAESVVPAIRTSAPWMKSGSQGDQGCMPRGLVGTNADKETGVEAARGAHSVQIVQRSPWRMCPTIHCLASISWAATACAYRSSRVGFRRNCPYHVEWGRRHWMSMPMCAARYRLEAFSGGPGICSGANAAVQSHRPLRS